MASDTAITLEQQLRIYFRAATPLATITNGEPFYINLLFIYSIFDVWSRTGGGISPSHQREQRSHFVWFKCECAGVCRHRREKKRSGGVGGCGTPQLASPGSMQSVEGGSQRMRQLAPAGRAP